MGLVSRRREVMTVDLTTFQGLPAAEVARLVRAAGLKVCVFPVNGTRRWFSLEFPPEHLEYMGITYFDVLAQRYVELYRLCFDHGLDTLLTPVFGPDLLDRGEEYAKIAFAGLARLATDPQFTDFYREYQICVRFYGDYRRFFAGTPYAYLPAMFDEVTAQTSSHDRQRLFYGVCANDATEAIGRLAIDYYAEHGRAPDRRTLVELYYGEYVPPVDIFIGFDRFWAFDMPLVATGREDLYFTISPSPYLTAPGLRAILHDHLYLRWVEEPDYMAMSAEDMDSLRSFYRSHQDKTLGVGVVRDGIWYPLPQVELPDGLAG
jgi:tuberculosinol/isotuberculosinol synthase